MSTVIVSEFMAARGLDHLASAVDLVYDRGLHADRSRLAALLGDAAGLVVRDQTMVDEALLGLAPGLKVVGRLGVGLDNIDAAALERRGVQLRTGAGLDADSVAEYVVTAAGMLVRRAFGHTAAILAGSWPRTASIGGELAGRSIGIVGLGAIGQAVAERAVRLQMQTVAFDPLLADDSPAWRLATRVGLEAALGADVVTLHVPLTAETKSLIDAAAISSMRDGAVLVNTAGGEIVDCSALAKALRDGKLAGAVLDVLPEEPPSADTRAVLADAPNLVLTPHVAGVTVESDDRIGTHVARAVVEVVTG